MKTSTFRAVFDTRKRKLRGIVSRNGRFYAQMRVSLPNGKSKAIRVPLRATRLDEVVAEAEKARTERRSGVSQLPKWRPQFAELAESYKESAAFMSKKEGTRQNEIQALNRWIAHLGKLRVDWIEEPSLTMFRDHRSKKGVSNRTINLDMTALNNAMRYAVERGWIKVAPRVRKLKEAKSPRRPLLSSAQIKLLLRQAEEVTKNAELLRLYIRFLVLTGCREQEALNVRKADVDMNRGVLHVGWNGDTKSGLGRDIQFNTGLRELLVELTEHLPDDTVWLFPSPQRGKRDLRAKSLRQSFYLVRKAAKLDWVGFHDFRHYFASQCVMAGIDYMTISKWLGHQDGGILVGKVYGHLSDDHRMRMAKKLNGLL